MTLYYSKMEPRSVTAIQYTKKTIGELAQFLGETMLFSDHKAYQAGRVLVADLQFPFWLEEGEWLTRDHETGELDGWADAHFRECYSLTTEKAAT